MAEMTIDSELGYCRLQAADVVTPQAGRSTPRRQPKRTTDRHGLGAVADPRRQDCLFDLLPKIIRVVGGAAVDPEADRHASTH